MSSLDSLRLNLKFDPSCECGLANYNAFKLSRSRAGSDYIVNGEVAAAWSLPWMISLEDDDGYYCGGSIVGTR